LFSFLSFPFLTARPSLPSTLGCGALCGGRDPPVMKHEGRGPPGRRRRRRCEPPAMEAPLTPLGCRYGGDPLGASSSLPAPSPRPASSPPQSRSTVIMRPRSLESAWQLQYPGSDQNPCPRNSTVEPLHGGVVGGA
jgi:hypothetical protein